MKTWIVDIDGTLALMGDRGPFDWKRVGEDAPNEPVVHIVESLIKAGDEIVPMSGRMEQCRDLTKLWLKLNVIGIKPFLSRLLMRPDGDCRPDRIVKRELYENYVKGVYDITGVIDDRASVVKMWREELGLTCIQVAPGDF